MQTIETTRKTRCYRQFCGVAKALDVIGERWTLLIVRDLLLGPWRFKDLLERLPGIPTNLLSLRMRELQQQGIVRLRKLSAPASGAVYELTEVGRELEPVCLALGKFGQRWLSAPAPDEKLDIGWALLSLKRRFQGGACSITLQVGAEAFQIRASAAYVDVRAGTPYETELQVALAPDSLRQLLFRDASAAVLENAGRLFVAGPRYEWNRFLACFNLRG
jgi:DNA-binding HxlR family transcriptional regulator